MELSEIRRLYRTVESWWKDNIVSGPREWAREIVSRELKIARLKADLPESTSTSVQLGIRLEKVKSVVAQLEERVRELSLLPEDAKRWLHAGDCTRINKQACTCGLAQYIHALGGEQLAKDNANELAQLEADIDYEETLDHEQTTSDARHAGCS